jgi:hypothetical protein
VGDNTTCGAPALVSQGVPIVAELFFFSGGGSTCGRPIVMMGNVNATKDLFMNNANGRFIFPGPVQHLKLDYEWQGGNLNLRVNGELRNVNNPGALAGVIGFAFLGQVQVVVSATSLEFFVLNGAIFDFAIGGQEFFIDNVDYEINECLQSTPPLAEITDPPNGACICAEADLKGTADDPDDGLDYYFLEYRRLFDPTWTTFHSDTTPVVNGLLGTFEPGALGLPQGVYLIQLTVVNKCGDDESYLIAVYYDNALDELSLDAPGNGDVVGGVVCFDGTVYDNGCFDQYVVGYRPAGGGGPYLPVDPANPVYFGVHINEVFASWNTVALGIPDGDYEIRIVAQTDCGYTDQLNLVLTVDNTWPLAEITNPLNCESVSGLVTVTGTAYDDNLAGWVLQFTGGPYNNWVTISSGNTNVVNGVLGVWDVTNLPPCCYTLRLVVSDQAIVNCNPAIHHHSEFEVSVDVNAEPCPDPGDINGDGVVNFLDINPFVQCVVNGGCP